MYWQGPHRDDRPNVDARRGQGFMFGDGNRQTNFFQTRSVIVRLGSVAAAMVITVSLLVFAEPLTDVVKSAAKAFAGLADSDSGGHQGSGVGGVGPTTGGQPQATPVAPQRGEVRLQPAAGAKTARITVIGKNFAAGESVSVKVGSYEVGMSNADSSGSFSVQVQIPDSAYCPQSQCRVFAHGNSTWNSAVYTIR
jgi:hypothetical protein